MSRLSAVGSIPIADRIKAFDNGSSKGKPRKMSSESPPPRNSLPSSPLFKTFPRTQFSAKDPTRPSPPTTNPSSRSTSRSSLASLSSVGKDDPNSSSTPPPAQIKNLLKPNSIHSVVTSSRSEKTTSKTVVTVENNDQMDSKSYNSSKNLSNSQESLSSSSNGEAFKHANEFEDTISKLNTVREDSGDVFVEGDTVDRARPRRSVIEVHQERDIPEKAPVASSFREEQLSVNNNRNTHRNANSNGQPHIWSKSSNGNMDQLETGNVTLTGREDKIYSFSSDSEELPSFSSSVTDEGEMKEVRDLRKAKREVDMRLVDREDQVEDLAQQVDMLLSVKSRLETELAHSRKEHKREVADKDDELEDTRTSAAKRVKILEQQLELEHEERLAFLRERHELEGKIMTLKDALDHGSSEEQVRKLKKDLKRSKALLKDAQLMLDKNNQEGINKIVLRQLKNQLEDAEFARTAAMKGRANTELELVEVNSMLEDVTRVRTELEEKMVKVGREKADLAQQLRENEEEMTELLKKYKAAVSACSVDQITIQDQAVYIQQLEAERNRAREMLAEMEVKVEHSKGEQVSVAQHRRLELRLREMDSKLELEKTGKSRLEVQVGRLKEVIEKLSKEGEVLRAREKTSVEEVKKMSKVLRELKEDLASYQGRDADFGQKKVDMEKMLEVAEAETIIAKNELKVALRRIEDLQAAIQGDMDTSAGDSDVESDGEGLGETEVWLEQARRRMVGVGGRRSSQSQHNSLSMTNTGHNSLTDLADKSFSTVSSIDGRDYEPAGN
eukprot:TRINITY_DN14591_c0_g1_i1.p1 TRINITY_DN14591_c0_g1~~TRINITY_DN14591_c0_g1_i1.p1  ORF type:complete len:785 (+),score=316.62 TRINITY_DN14591_c0_g1_i1:56-2410(+)